MQRTIFSSKLVSVMILRMPFLGGASSEASTNKYGSHAKNSFYSNRYFSNTMLDSIHRGVALREWSHAGIYDERPPAHELEKNYPKKRLEKLLGAFDMFFIEQEDDDIDWVCV